MAIIAGTTMRWPFSPRIAVLPSGTSSANVEDMQDTLLDLEVKEEGIIFPYTRDTSGGENLGGGVTVGLTMELKDVQIEFPRTSSIESGTVTTADSLGITLTDSAATFITNGVVRGDWVVNFTDQSVTEIIEVISETELTCNALTDGATNQFNISDSYKVWNVEEAQLEGGNFVAVDSVDAELNPVFPTFGRFISKASASSATTTSLESLEAAALNGGIAVDPTSPYTLSSAVSGVLGSREFPLNNMADVLALSISRGVAKIFVLDDLTVSGVDLSSEFHEFVGDNRSTVLTIDGTADTTGDNFTRLTLQGDLGGSNTIEDCIIGNITNVSGAMENISYVDNADITLNGDLSIDRSVVERIGFVWPRFNVNANNLNVVGHTGGLSINNQASGGGNTSVVFEQGFIVFDASCTGGTALLTGEMRQDVTDNSAGAVAITNATNSTIRNEMHERLDLNSSRPNTYTKNPDGTITITGTNFILTETLNPDLTKTVQRS